MQIRYYRVGDHPLSICFARDDEADQLLPSFARFRLDTPPSDPLLLRVDVDDRLPWDEPHHEVGHFDSAGNMYGVYLRADGGYQYEINDIQGVLCARVTTDATFGHVAVALVGETPAQRHFGLNNTLMLAYLEEYYAIKHAMPTVIFSKKAKRVVKHAARSVGKTAQCSFSRSSMPQDAMKKLSAR